MYQNRFGRAEGGFSCYHFVHISYYTDMILVAATASALLTLIFPVPVMCVGARLIFFYLTHLF